MFVGYHYQTQTERAILLGELSFQLWQRILLLLQVPLCGALLNVCSVVVCFAHLQLPTQKLKLSDNVLKINLSGAHEECVELVWVAFEQEGLGSVLVQHSNRIVHLQKKCKLLSRGGLD